MKKILVLAALAAVFMVNMMFSEAEVSEKKEVGIFPVYSSYDVPNTSEKYFDDRLIASISGMKRFQVVGYQYRLDGNSAEAFIAKIQDLKKQKALKDSKYMDQDLGIAVIPAADMEKLANSFFIFIPSINGYATEVVYEDVYNVIKKRNESKKFYKVNVNISVKIITAEGNLLNTYESSVEQKSESSYQDGFQNGIRTALGGLELFLRNTDEFKLKTKVLDISSKGVALQLGNDLGVKEGYEFFVTKTKDILGFQETENVGLIRVHTTKEKLSYATSILGDPKIGDQLMEAPLAGIRTKLFAGISSMVIPNAALKINIRDSSPSSSFYAADLGLSASTYVPTVGIHFQGEIGYAGLFDFNLGAMFNTPIAGYLEMGGGYELYMGPVSLSGVLDLSIIASYSDIGYFVTDGYSIFGDTTFYDPTGTHFPLTLIGGSLGLKPKLSFNIQFSQGFKLAITAGYGIYFLDYYRVQITGTQNGSDDKKQTALIDIANNPNVTFTQAGQDIVKLPIDYNGLTAGIELIGRF